MTLPPLSKHLLTAFDTTLEQLMHLLSKLPQLLLAILIVLVAFWLGGVISRRMRIITRLRSSNPYADGLLRNGVRAVVSLAGVLIALDVLNATSLVGAVLGSAGVVGLVLGFAFKDIAENYISGILLSLRRPFSPDDSVRIDTYEGRVVALSSRATILMTSDGIHLQLPNSLVFKSVLLNYSRNPKRRFDFSLAVNHAASLHTAMDTGLATLAAVDGVLDQPAPNALVQTVTIEGVGLHFTAWIDQTHNDLSRTRSEAIRQVRTALWHAGIPPAEPSQRVTLIRNDAAESPVDESTRTRDTSVDHALDAQVGHARQQEEAVDLLTTNQSPASATKPDGR